MEWIRLFFRIGDTLRVLMKLSNEPYGFMKGGEFIE
jgi:hypothetical protein